MGQVGCYELTFVYFCAHQQKKQQLPNITKSFDVICDSFIFTFYFSYSTKSSTETAGKQHKVVEALAVNFLSAL